MGSDGGALVRPTPAPADLEAEQRCGDEGTRSFFGRLVVQPVSTRESDVPGDHRD